MRTDNNWNEILYQDYRSPNLHITYLEAIGRRIRRNYGWIFMIQVVAYIGKLMIHPMPISSLEEIFVRATIGPVPGQIRPAGRLRVPCDVDRHRLLYVQKQARGGPRPPAAPATGPYPSTRQGSGVRSAYGFTATPQGARPTVSDLMTLFFSRSITDTSLLTPLVV